MKLVKYGNLNVDQESQLMLERRQGSVSICIGSALQSRFWERPSLPVIVSSRSLTRIAPFVGFVALVSTLS